MKWLPIAFIFLVSALGAQFKQSLDEHAICVAGGGVHCRDLHVDWLLSSRLRGLHGNVVGMLAIGGVNQGSQLKISELTG